MTILFELRGTNGGAFRPVRAVPGPVVDVGADGGDVTEPTPLDVICAAFVGGRVAGPPDKLAGRCVPAVGSFAPCQYRELF